MTLDKLGYHGENSLTFGILWQDVITVLEHEKNLIPRLYLIVVARWD